jgi:hypothetical protein
MFASTQQTLAADSILLRSFGLSSNETEPPIRLPPTREVVIKEIAYLDKVWISPPQAENTMPVTGSGK